MDQSQADKKSPNIWNKFESAAQGVPDWIQNKEQTGNILHTLLKTIPAKAILISTTSDVFLLVGDLEESIQRKILQVLGHFWDPVQKSDLTRYLKNEKGEVIGFIFCANLFQQLIITLYYRDTPTLSMALAHTKRITRALSGQTVASYEAKTIPVDAAVAAQMRKFYEQKSKQKQDATEVEEELPKANINTSLVSEAPITETQEIQPSTEQAPVLEPQDSVRSDILSEEESTSEDLLPSMDDLFGDVLDTQDVDISTASVIEEIENQASSQAIPDKPIEEEEDAKEIKIDFQNAGINAESQEIEEISEEDLALLSNELDDFFMDDDSDIDLEEQKEKLAALLQEMPAPDPDADAGISNEDIQDSDLIEEPVMQVSQVEEAEQKPESAQGEEFNIAMGGRSICGSA